MALLLILLILLILLHSPPPAISSSSHAGVYIAYMGAMDAGSDADAVRQQHHGALTAVLGSEDAALGSILYSYRHAFSGFAAVLTAPQAAAVADLPGVSWVSRNRVLELHTTRSWDFLHVDAGADPMSILSASGAGRDSIIGVLDTGIWPESESFRDAGIGPVPPRWKGRCVPGDNFTAAHCNRKIIGARWYVKGYEAESGKLNTSEVFEYLSPRDAVGHGTHTASTAAGNWVANASFMGLGEGFARGGAPAARIAVYKVCWATGDCTSADILAAFDDAIHDGVDVLSVSLGQAPPLPGYVDDIVAIGSFHAVARGITVVCSAGNSGPYSQTVINAAPWIISVAASTIDRTFLSKITIGNNSTYIGQTMYVGKHPKRSLPLVLGEDSASSHADASDARSCNAGSLNATLVRAKVVLCFQTRTQRSASVAVETVSRWKGAGVIFAQFQTKDIASAFDIPCVQVDIATGTSILAYITSTGYGGTASAKGIQSSSRVTFCFSVPFRGPTVRFSNVMTVSSSYIAPEVAFFSSRGPSSLSPAVLKPDIAAPGVNILAAWSPASSLTSGTVGPVDFKIDSGTSMSCPHVSGIAALLKSMHPDWSPAAIKSALITTADSDDEAGFSIVAEGGPYKQADAFDYGGGQVNPNRAADPGLVYDMSVHDHIDFLCSMGYNDSAISSMTRHKTVCRRGHWSQMNLNLPSITIPDLRKTLKVMRTVTNVGPSISVYKARLVAPRGVKVVVAPSVLIFNTTTKQLTFTVSFKPRQRLQGRYTFGSLSWEDGVHSVRIPLAVRTVLDGFDIDE